METLYLDSRSSNEDVVFLAWRSKSSFDTSMSRSLSCIDLLVSRREVISFWRVVCAVLASALDCLYFVYNGKRSAANLWSLRSEMLRSVLRMSHGETDLPFFNLVAQGFYFLL